MGKNKDRSKLLSKCIRWGFLVAAFVLGCWAYWPALGTLEELQNHWDVAYHAMDLMTGAKPLMKPVDGFMGVARFLCPALAGAFLVSCFSSFLLGVAAWLRSWLPNAVAAHGENRLIQSLPPSFIRAGKHFLGWAKPHIVLMDSDEETIAFFKKHEKRLTRTPENTYIGLQEMSAFLMKSPPHVWYFNIYEEIARDYWKNHSLLPEVQEKSGCQIVILDYERSGLGYRMLKYGLMNNLFRKGQAITYHVFCKSQDAGNGFEKLDLTHGMEDRLVWHTEPWSQKLEVLEGADRILLCGGVCPGTLNQLLLACTGQAIHYYDPEGATYPQGYAYPKLAAFGCTSQVLTRDAILKKALYREAIHRNYRYEMKFGSQPQGKPEETVKMELWRALDGFAKNSNVATADYYDIYPVQPDISPAEKWRRAELEHIRWCRFHYLHGWQQGQPENGQRKDKEKRIHKALVPWDQLSREDQEKDLQQVELDLE